MIKLAMKTTPALSRGNVLSLNSRVTPAYSRNTIKSMGAVPVTRSAPRMGTPMPAAPRQEVRTPQPARRLPDMKPPQLVNPVAKGQKFSLGIAEKSPVKLRVRFGWNIKNPECDIDASAFLLREDGKVASDDWFVFYGQEMSPDGSVEFNGSPAGGDRECVNVDISRVHSSVKRIVFVVTINEAIEKRLNFSMVKDAYVRVMDDRGRELVSFMLNEYYETATSMTMAEMYLHNGQWKFNPVGNGVKQDLAGQCAIYGVGVI